MKQEEDKPLMIPVNCPPAEYIIEGFKSTDMTSVVACGVVGVIFGIVLWMKNGNSIMGVAVFFLIVIIAVTLFRRDKYSENLIDKIRIHREFKHSQKRFDYKHINTWEVGRINAITRK